MSDDAFALMMALSAVAAAAVLWHRIQQARSVRRLERLLHEKRMEIASGADTAAKNDPPVD